jgi:hypothetical protein
MSTPKIKTPASEDKPSAPPPDTLEAAAKALAAEIPPATTPPPATDAPADLVELPETGIVRVLHPVKHDGKVFGPGLPNGDEIEVTADVARDLERLGALGK